MSSSRGSWFAPEPRLSYNEIKELMAQATQALKEKEEKEKKEKEKAALSSAVKTESVLTESKAFNIGVGNTADSAKVTKHDWRSMSAREPRASATARAGLSWNSRGGGSGTFEKWAEEYQICEESSARNSSDFGTPSENQRFSGANRRKAGLSCRTTKSNISAVDCVSGGDNSRQDKLSRTKAWVDEAVAQRSFDVSAVDSNTSAGDSNTSQVPGPPRGPSDGGRLPLSPEIQEEEEAEIVLQTLEKSAHIEDQLPGRLSQSVRFIKSGTSVPVFLSREQKKKSTSAFRAFSAKLASKLARLFSSKSARRAASGTSSSGSMDSSESPKMKSLSLHKWLQRQSSKARDQAEVPRPGLQPSKSGKVEHRRSQSWRKGKENVEVRELSAPPLEAAQGYANFMVLKDVDCTELAAPFSSSFTSNRSLPPLAGHGVSSQRVRALDRGSRFAVRKSRNLWSRHCDTASSPKKQVSPREYLTSVLGWEPSLIDSELPKTRMNCAVNRVWPEQGNSPTGPGDDLLSETCEGTGQTRPIDIVAPSVTAAKNDPVGSEGASLLSTTTVSGSEPKSVPEEDVSDSTTDSEKNALVLNLVDNGVFSFDGSLPSADWPKISSATSEAIALTANGAPSPAAPSVSGDADRQEEIALLFQVQTNPFLPSCYQTNPFLSCADQTNPLRTLEWPEIGNVADLASSHCLNLGEPKSLDAFESNELKDAFSAHYATCTCQCSRSEYPNRFSD